MGFMSTRWALPTLATGSLTGSMAREKRDGLMVLNTKGASLKETSKALESSIGSRMAAITRESGSEIASMVSASTLGRTAGGTLAIGTTTRCMDWESIGSLKERYTKDSSIMRRKRGMGSSFGKMGGTSKDGGTMASNRDWAFTLELVKESKILLGSMACGRWERGSSGSLPMMLS